MVSLEARAAIDSGSFSAAGPSDLSEVPSKYKTLAERSHSPAVHMNEHAVLSGLCYGIAGALYVYQQPADISHSSAALIVYRLKIVNCVCPA